MWCWIGLRAAGFSLVLFRSYLKLGVILLCCLEEDKCGNSHSLLLFGCFEGIGSSVNLVSDKIKFFCFFWVSINPLFHGILLDQIILNWEDFALSY